MQKKKRRAGVCLKGPQAKRSDNSKTEPDRAEALPPGAPERGSALSDRPNVASVTSDATRDVVDLETERWVVGAVAGEPALASRDPDLPVSSPDRDTLLTDQLVFTARGGQSDPDFIAKRGCGALTLYQSFGPADGTESALVRVAVGLTNATMDSLDRAAAPNQTPAGREMELKLSVKTASALVSVVTLFEKHRGLDRQNVNVGNVNIGSGGQAIVGNVQAAPQSAENQAEASKPTANDEPEAA